MTLLSDDSLARLDKWASIFAKVAIPLVIALAGWWVQKSMSDEGLRKDYVQMAVGILSDPEKQKEEDLRKWAIAVLEKNSPVPFSPSLKANLLKGAYPYLLAKPYPVPPAALMQPPATLEPLPARRGVTLPEVYAAARVNERACRENSERLEGLQLWVATTQKAMLPGVIERGYIFRR